jgi:hypothetical protein
MDSNESAGERQVQIATSVGEEDSEGPSVPLSPKEAKEHLVIRLQWHITIVKYNLHLPQSKSPRADLDGLCSTEVLVTHRCSLKPGVLSA